jgi:hypothetical protein
VQIYVPIDPLGLLWQFRKLFFSMKCHINMRPSLLLYLIVLVSAIGFVPRLSRAQANTLDGFQTKYSSAFVVTPINTMFDIVPNGNVDLVFSASAEFSFRKSAHLGYAIAGGYYPYIDRQEALVSFSLRQFSASSEAPTGGYFDWMAIGGGEKDRNSDRELQPMFGLGIKLGSLRATRFSDFGIEYGASTAVVLIGGQPQFRAAVFFGLGFLLGKEVLVR